MKLATFSSILTTFLNPSNYKKMDFKNTNENKMKYSYWDKECLEHPTNNSCLIYCD